MIVSEAIRYFRVTPQAVRADCETKITIQSLDPKKGFQNGKRYRLRYHAVDRSDNLSVPKWKELEVTADKNAISFSQYFCGEQEHYVYIEGIDVAKNIRFSIYSLKEDLFGKIPLKGDFHMHSNNSDGADYAPHVSAMCRKVGFDFMALTDHRQYRPSLEAIDAYKDVKTDLIMMPGEEVHPNGNNVHIINFGARISVNDYIREHREEYERELDEILRTDETLKEVEGFGQRICASCVWCFRKIRENGGLSIFCHPYWYIPEGCQDYEEVNEYLMRHAPQDAEELIGGYAKHEVFSHDLEIARFMESYHSGVKRGIVGVSDAHSTEADSLFGWYYTIVFAENRSGQSVIDAVRNCMSTAVTHIQGETLRVYGDFRLVKYSHFLAQNYFPLHDEMCAEEGYLMYRYWSGDNKDKAAKCLEILSGQTEEYYRSFFGINSID